MLHLLSLSKGAYFFLQRMPKKGKRPGRSRANGPNMIAAKKKSKEKVVAVGIDLGTTNSCVAVWLESEGRAKVIKAATGVGDARSRTSPSIASVSKRGRIAKKWQVSSVGHLARCEVSEVGAHLIRGVKHVIGRTYQEYEEARRCDSMPVSFRLVKGDVFRRGENNLLIAPTDDARGVSPVEISEAILTGLKTRAEIFLGKTVTHAVIGVPAYFNALQRAHTKMAAESAGLNVLRLLSEPMAAATAYGLGVAGSKTVVVTDFGGGTFDVSVLSIVNGTFKALAIGGSNSIGGDALDLELARLCMKEWSLPRSGVEGRDLEILCEACEVAKRALSSQDVASVEFEFRGVSYSLDINLGQFERLVRPCLQECMKIVRGVVDDACLNCAVDEIVLVGGSTQLPLFRSMLQEEFPSVELCKSIRSDCTVAEGAAIRAAMMTGADEYRLKKVLMLDALPFSVGLEDSEGNFRALIPRNSRLPASSTMRFRTFQDGQRGLSVDVFEGEHPRASDNKWLGYHNFMIPYGSEYKAGERSLEITFSVDADGILTVRADPPEDEADYCKDGDGSSSGDDSGTMTVVLVIALIVLSALYVVAKSLFPSTDAVTAARGDL